MIDQRGQIVDDLLMLRVLSATALATATYATYGAATPKTIDLGGAGYTEGKLVIDITTADGAWGTVASGAVVDFILRGSNRSSFDSGFVPLARFRVGTVFAAESIKDSGLGGSSSGTTQTGRFIVPWTNDFGGTTYRYLRLRILFGGTFYTGLVLGNIFLTKN